MKKKIIILCVLLAVGAAAIYAIYYVKVFFLPAKELETKLDLARMKALSNKYVKADNQLHDDPELNSIILRYRFLYEKNLREKINKIAISTFGVNRSTLNLSVDVRGSKNEKPHVYFVSVEVKVDETISDKIIESFKQSLEKEIGLPKNEQCVTVAKIAFQNNK